MTPNKKILYKIEHYIKINCPELIDALNMKFITRLEIPTKIHIHSKNFIGLVKRKYSVEMIHYLLYQRKTDGSRIKHTTEY